MKRTIWLGLLIAVFVLGTALWWQYSTISSRRNHPVAVYLLPGEVKYSIWKDVGQDDWTPIYGLLFVIPDEGYTGVVEHAGKSARVSFDILNDYPPERVEVTTVDGEMVIEHTPNGTVPLK